MSIYRKSLAAALIAAIGGTAIAAGPIRIETHVFAEQRSAAADGTTHVTLVPAAHVTPGDRVVYRIDYSNSGGQPVGNFAVSNPVPRDLVYLAPTAGSPEPDVSVDGTTFAPLSALRVTGGNGIQRPAAAGDVRIVRWRLATPLAAGASGQFAFRAALR